MSQPSSWPLTADATRVFLPRFLVDQLAVHPLARDLYPLGFGHYPHARGHRMARDSHDDCLLLYCTAGRGWLETDDGREDIAAGTLVVLPPGVAHRYAADARDPWSLWWVHFNGEALPAMLELLGPGERRAVAIGLQAGLVSEFRALLAAQQTGYAIDAWVHAAARLRVLLTLIAMKLPRAGEARSERLDVERVTAWMREHVGRPVELSELAAATSGLSIFHFSRRFRAATGMAPIQYFIHLRMEHACRLLDLSGEPVHAVARRLGYDDPYYFSRLFRKVIGVSPSDYRKLAR